jgi:uncharacterized protein (DUF2147 family)
MIHQRIRTAFGIIIPLGLVAIVLLLADTVSAEANSPVGVWQTIDDDTGRPKSHVQITERNGKLTGKIIKLINPDEPDPLCTECTGNRKNQKITGMVILWNLTKDGDRWENGSILDPNNGKTYRCRITVTNGGKNLDVRGFIGLAFIGRTQTWNRIR